MGLASLANLVVAIAPLLRYCFASASLATQLLAKQAKQAS
jgi:hypothetical protein